MQIIEVDNAKYQATKELLDGLTKPKIKIGVNVVTKSIERKSALLVVIAEDTNPIDIVMHIGPLAKQAGVKVVVFPEGSLLAQYAGLSSGRKASCLSVVGVTEEDKAKLDELISQL